MNNDNGVADTKGLSRLRRLSTLIVVVCIILFFILLQRSNVIKGYLALSYPIVLGVGLFFSAFGYTGKVRTALKYLGFFLLLSALIILISLVTKHL